MVDVDASGATVSKFVAVERADEGLKAGCRVELPAQCSAIYIQFPTRFACDNLDGVEQQRRGVVRVRPVRRDWKSTIRGFIRGERFIYAFASCSIDICAEICLWSRSVNTL